MYWDSSLVSRNETLEPTLTWANAMPPEKLSYRLSPLKNLGDPICMGFQLLYGLIKQADGKIVMESSVYL